MEEPAAAAAYSQQIIRPAAPVRVVARICPGGTGSFQVAARVVDSSAVVSLLPLHEDTAPRPGAPAPRKDHDYRLDCCYSEDCHEIFNGEVKPLVDAVFRGTNSCVVACGASAKTNLVTGQPAGLLTMTVEQILLLSQPVGASVSISFYHVLQDTHIFDLLEPKENEVLVLEDADGRTNLKGLSRVRVKSIQEFVDLCSCCTDMLKHPTKPSNNMQPKGGHHGFIIYVSRFDQEGKECAIAKMNFLDLAGYVDPKQRTNGGGLSRQNCNKSMHALINVVQALNSNQSFIPYRQSKLTRMLQDSLCKKTSAVLIACLDEFSGQDVVSTLSLASRSSQRVNEQYCNFSLGARISSKSNVNLSASAKNLSRSLLSSIHRPNSALNKHNRAQFNNGVVKGSQTCISDKRSKLAMHSTKKPVSLLSADTKKRSAKPVLTGRNLFCPGTNLSKEDKIVIAPIEVTKAEACDETEKVIKLVPCNPQEPVSSSMQEEDSSSGSHADHSCTNLKETYSSDVAEEVIEKTPVGATESSPKLTDRLREISNSLKLLSTMPMSVTKQKADLVDDSEPKTPAIHLKFGHSEDSHELLKARSTGVKKNLVKECLTYLNSANKEQLKSLKGIGEKRANYILELREESPELFKEVDDLKNIIGMNKKEIKTLMSGMVMDL